MNTLGFMHKITGPFLLLLVILALAPGRVQAALPDGFTQVSQNSPASTEEDQSGEPFVGPAGQLLTKIIKAMHLTRAEVYIANIIKCRPPANRNPDEDEIVTCMPFVKRQIDAIKPDYIVALGKVAAQSLLGNREPISRLRGKFYDFSGIKLMPTYHPAYLLRNPAKKREVWNDMQRLMKEMAHED